MLNLSPYQHLLDKLFDFRLAVFRLAYFRADNCRPTTSRSQFEWPYCSILKLFLPSTHTCIRKDCRGEQTHGVFISISLSRPLALSQCGLWRALSFCLVTNHHTALSVWLIVKPEVKHFSSHFV